MSILKTIIRGESLSLGFIFPNDYNLSRIEGIKVYVGSKLCDVTRNETIVTCRIKSDDTKNFGTINKVTFWLDDSSLGVQKLYVGDICVDGTNAIASNESVNLGFDIVVNLTISETAISFDSVLYDVMKGDKGDAGEVEEAPIDDLQYARKNGGWEVVSGGGGHIISNETQDFQQQPKLKFVNAVVENGTGETIVTIPEGGSEVYIGADAPTADTDELWIDTSEEYPQVGIITVSTFADMELQANGIYYKQFYVLNDETNGNEPTRYDWTGSKLIWVITQEIN